MMRLRKFAAALAAATMLAGPALAESVPAPKLMADPAIWMVKDADTTIYLLGTVHVLKPGTEWLDGGVKKAYDASSEVVLEVLQPDNPAAMQPLMAKYGVDPDGPPLTAKLPADQRAPYEEAVKAIGAPVAAFETFQPWTVSMILSLSAIQKAGYAPDSGVERQIAAAAKRDGKTLGQLETLDQQLGFFASLPEPAQVTLLTQTLGQLKNVGPMFDKMVADWAKGDPEALAKLLNEAMTGTPELTKVLLTDRNTRWAQWIDDRLDKPGTVFVAVGAGHLAGKGSVQDALKVRKLRAKRIRS